MTDWNDPDSPTVLRPWLLIDPLNLFQAVMLIFGRDPSHHFTGRPQGYVPIAAAMKQAIDRGELPVQRTFDPYWENKYLSLDVDERSPVKQADVRKWLKKIGNVDAFFFLSEPKDWPNKLTTEPVTESKSLETKERETLLALIGTLCELAGFDLRNKTKGHAEANAMKEALDARKVNLTSQTVAAKIAAGRELIAPKGPERLEFK